VTAPDDDTEAAPQRVVSMTALTVVTQPGAVKLMHRSGRVLHTFAGPSMREEGRALIDELCRVFDDERRIQREVELLKPWWRRFW
jgi:hypothetical protein